MNARDLRRWIEYICMCFFFCIPIVVVGQDVTKVSGHVYDEITKEPLGFVNISFEGTNVGTTTDLDGFFTIDSRFVNELLCASFLGYEDQCQTIKIGEKNRNLEFLLRSSSVEIESVTIVAKKKKYSKKNNPAVDLMRKVIANKKENRLEGQDYYSFDQYEQIELDLNNITEEFKENRIFKHFGLLWNYLDTSEVNGKVFLPVFLREVKSKVYYRKSPEDRKEYREGIKVTKFHDRIDDQSLTDAVDFLYQDIDIYDNVIPIANNNFVSPISPLAINFYRFYILDTTYVNGVSSIRLGFIPRNKANFGFTGDLYVSNDSSAHYVVSADFGIIGNINLNFVRDLKVRQDFRPLEGAYVKTRDDLTIDYSITKNGIGFYGNRSVSYDNFSFTPTADISVFDPIDKTIIVKGAYEQDDNYWETVRLKPLSQNQENLYQMIEELTEMPAYKNLVRGIQVVTTGFFPLSKFDIGPIPTFYSFNQVEGSRVKLGAETNLGFSPRLLLSGYGAYGFRDKTWKYKGELTYTFNEDYKRNPRHYLRFTYHRDVTFPGQDLQFIQNDNFLLSFRRGATNRMILNKEARIDYTKETPSFATDLWFARINSIPYGDLSLPITGANGEVTELAHIKTAVLGIGFEYSPNKQFIQGRQYRRPIINEYPIWTARYEKGIKGLLGTDYNFHKIELGFFKKVNMSVVGHTNLSIEAGKIWGELPYVSLFIPRANQSYSYQRASFNMMNFMEFVSDEYVHVRMQHFFKGFILNRVPLIKRLGLREIVTFKAVYGRLNDKNNPELNGAVPGFSDDVNGNSLSYTFGDVPYMEGSIGIANIFKAFRVDLIKRFTYLDHPDVPSLFGHKGLGLRVKLKVEF